VEGRHAELQSLRFPPRHLKALVDAHVGSEVRRSTEDAARAISPGKGWSDCRGIGIRIAWKEIREATASLHRRTSSHIGFKPVQQGAGGSQEEVAGKIEAIRRAKGEPSMEAKCAAPLPAAYDRVLQLA